MGNLNYIVFGGVDSRDYGIYISGEGVFNAPERDVEVVNIPGKDGDLLIDRGRFLNIEVTYPGFNFEPDLSTFAERLRAFRAALASQVGYQRLEDSFHPDEFRLASFRSGLDVKPVMYNTASTFDIVFDCKPQRFLKSGEEEITIGEWGETETAEGEIVTFNAESNTGIKSLVANIEPIQSGSGDPSPTNVRPIIGWSGVNVEHTGVNIWDEEWEVGKWTNGVKEPSVSQIRSKNYISVRPDATYVLVAPVAMKLVKFDVNKNFIADMAWYPNATIQMDINCYYIAFCSYNNPFYGTTYNNDISINYPSTDTSYRPYQGESYSIPFKDSQGNPITVYGGEIDVVSGLLKSYPFYSSYNGETLSGEWICDRAVYSEGTTPPIGSQVVDMSGNGTEYQLTPTEINTLLGTNNIWADSGEVSVEYGADPNILVNPTPFEALPIFEVVGTGSLTVGNTTVTITGDSTQDIFIDSDIMESYEDDNGAIISRNDRISLSGMNFPTLGTDTGITYTGLTSVKVTPRWWTI